MSSPEAIRRRRSAGAMAQQQHDTISLTILVDMGVSRISEEQK